MAALPQLRFCCVLRKPAAEDAATCLRQVLMQGRVPAWRAAHGAWSALVAVMACRDSVSGVGEYEATWVPAGSENGCLEVDV